jgi:hypothetical protein
MSEEPRACARLLHLCSRGGPRKSIMGPSQTTAITNLGDRRSPTLLGMSERLCRFGLSLGEFWIGARLDALLDDVELGRGQARQERGRGEHCRGPSTRSGRGLAQSILAKISEIYDRWLGPTTGIDDLKSMLKPYDAALMEAYAVNRAVNSVKNDTEECIEPVAD